MSTLNKGTQIISFRYEHPATADEFDALLKNILKTGIYYGQSGLIEYYNGTSVKVNPFAGLFDSSTDKTVAIRTEGVFYETVTPVSTSDYFYATYSWSETTNNYLDFAVRSTGSVAITNEVILGTINSLSGVITSVNTNGQTKGMWDVGTKSISIDTIKENTVGNGTAIQNNTTITGNSTVTGNLICDTLEERTASNGVNFNSVVKANVINEKTTNSGVAVESVHFENGFAYIEKLIRTFIVTSGETVTAGDVVEYINGTIRKGIGDDTPVFGSSVQFDADASNMVYGTTISENKILIVYRSDTGGSDGYVVVCTILGTVPSFGTPQAWTTNNVTTGSVATIGEDKVIIAFQDASTSNYGKVIIGTISGNVITFGSIVTYEGTAAAGTNHVIALGEDKAFITFRQGGTLVGRAIICTVSGTVPTFGTAVTYETGDTGYNHASLISENKVLVAFRDGGNSNKGKAIVCTIVGTVPTFGTAVNFESGQTAYITTSILSENKALIVYTNQDDSSYGKVIVALVSGNVVTYGDIVTFNSSASQDYSVLLLSENKVFIALRDAGDTDNGKAIICNVSGTTPSFGSLVTFETAFISVAAGGCLVSENKVVIPYYESTGADGRAIVCDLSTPLGIAQETGSDGASVLVALPGGISTVQTGLTADIDYFSTNGDLTTFRTNPQLGSKIKTAGVKYIGKAISATEILIDKDLK